MDNNFNNQNENQSYGNQSYQGQSYDNQQYQGDSYQSQSYQGNSYENQPYQNQPYQNQAYGNQPYQNQPYYGYQQPIQDQVPDNDTKALAIISLICGICSIVMMCCSFYGLIAGAAAIILAMVYKSKSPFKKFNGLSLAGLICGIIGSVCSCIFIFIYFLSNLIF